MRPDIVYKPVLAAELQGAPRGTPVLVSRDQTLLVCDGGITAFDLSAAPDASVQFGAARLKRQPVRWQIEAPAPIAGFVTDLGKIYASAGRHIYRLDVLLGVARSEIGVESRWGSLEATADLLPPVMAGGYVYAVAGDGTAYKIAKDDGDLVWSVDFGDGPVVQAPTTTNDALVFVRGRDLLGLSLDDGRELWRQPLATDPQLVDFAWHPRPAPAAPVVVKGAFLVPFESDPSPEREAFFTSATAASPGVVFVTAPRRANVREMLELFAVRPDHGESRVIFMGDGQSSGQGRPIYRPCDFCVSEDRTSALFTARYRDLETFYARLHVAEDGTIARYQEGTALSSLRPVTDAYLAPDPYADAETYWWTTARVLMGLSPDLAAGANQRPMTAPGADGDLQWALTFTAPPVVTRSGVVFAFGTDDDGTGWAVVLDADHARW